MNRENSTLEGSQLSIVFGASKYSSEKKDGNSDEKCWTCWDSGFAFNVLSSKQMSLGKSGWVLAIITLPASHWESTSSTVLLKKKRTSELQDPWIHVSNANVEVPSFRHLSLVGVLPWYKPNINAQRRKRFLSFSINLVSMFPRNQGANFKCFTTAANWPCSLAAASSSWIVTMEELWTHSMRHQNISDCNDRIHQLTSLAKCGMNMHEWSEWSFHHAFAPRWRASHKVVKVHAAPSVNPLPLRISWSSGTFLDHLTSGMKSCVHCHVEWLVSGQQYQYLYSICLKCKQEWTLAISCNLKCSTKKLQIDENTRRVVAVEWVVLHHSSACVALDLAKKSKLCCSTYEALGPRHKLWLWKVLLNLSNCCIVAWCE